MGSIWSNDHGKTTITYCLASEWLVASLGSFVGSYFRFDSIRGYHMDVATSKVNVAVIGVGRMGGLHARTYQRLSGANLVAVADSDLESRQAIAENLGCDAYATYQELFSAHPDIAAVSVAVPTEYHLKIAGELLQRRVACLVEKPLASTAGQARELQDIAMRHDAILQVGHTERFNPAVRAVAALEVTPRFIQVDRISPMTFRSLDIGVVMDLMIHDLDIVLMLAGTQLERVYATGVAVLGEHEDIANARLVFDGGCVANLTASRLALKTERKLRLFSDQAYVSLDYQARHGVMIRKTGNVEALAQVRQQIADGADLTDLDYSQLVHVEQLAMDEHKGEQDPLTAELASFLTVVARGTQPEVDGEAGCAAIEVAQRVISAVEQHVWEGLDQQRV